MAVYYDAVNNFDFHASASSIGAGPRAAADGEKADVVARALSQLPWLHFHEVTHKSHHARGRLLYFTSETLTFASSPPSTPGLRGTRCRSGRRRGRAGPGRPARLSESFHRRADGVHGWRVVDLDAARRRRAASSGDGRLPAAAAAPDAARPAQPSITSAAWRAVDLYDAGRRLHEASESPSR